MSETTRVTSGRPPATAPSGHGPTPDAEPPRQVNDDGIEFAVSERQLRQSRVEPLVTAGLRLAILAGILAVWELASRYWVDPYYISQPSEVGTRLWEWITDGILFPELWSTLRVTLMGFGLGAITGSVIGFVLALNARVGMLMGPFIQAAYSIPKVALAPLFILWFGIGQQMKVVLTGVIVFFLVFWTTYNAVRNVEKELVDVVRLMGAKRRHIVVKVAMPGAMPGVLQGLKLAVPYSLIGAIVGELLITNSGIGFLIQRARAQYDTAGVFAGIVVLMLLAVLMDALLRALESRTTRWRQQ